MNIPPLISRTPPPISDVAEDEDEDDDDDDDDNLPSYSSLNFSHSNDQVPSAENIENGFVHNHKHTEFNKPQLASLVESSNEVYVSESTHIDNNSIDLKELNETKVETPTPEGETNFHTLMSPCTNKRIKITDNYDDFQHYDKISNIPSEYCEESNEPASRNDVSQDGDISVACKAVLDCDIDVLNDSLSKIPEAFKEIPASGEITEITFSSEGTICLENDECIRSVIQNTDIGNDGEDKLDSLNYTSSPFKVDSSIAKNSYDNLNSDAESSTFGDYTDFQHFHLIDEPTHDLQEYHDTSESKTLDVNILYSEDKIPPGNLDESIPIESGADVDLEFHDFSAVHYENKLTGKEQNLSEVNSLSSSSENKLSFTVPIELTQNAYQDPLSSQFSSFDSEKNSVTIDNDLPDEMSKIENSNEDYSNSNDNNIYSANELDFSINPSLEFPCNEFSVTFPDVVENYHLDPTVCDSNADEFSDFVKCTIDPDILSDKQPCQSNNDPYHFFIDEFVDAHMTPALLLCLKQEVGKTSIWNKLSNLESTPALDYRWGDSSSSSRLLSALKIDSRNILTGHWTKNFKKHPSKDFRDNIGSNESFSEISFNKALIPHPQFEWDGSGLINPLDDSSCSHVKKANISISKEAEKVLTLFPDLSYLKQSFIVFPKNIN